jgi:hypothetical protein
MCLLRRIMFVPEKNEVTRDWKGGTFAKGGGL